MKSRMIIIFVVASLIVAVTLLANLMKKNTRDRVASHGSEVHGLVLMNPEGGSWRIEDEKGSVVILNFWASWCISCKAEMPSMNDFYKSIKNDPKIKLITVLYRDKIEDAISYLKSSGYDFPVKVDPSLEAASYFGVTGVPETYIIDKEGRLVEKVIGPFDWNDKSFRSYILALK